jgi:predicted HAD superfamily Cof-like phosphohydrolase
MQTWEEMLITKILTQAVEDARYTGHSKKYLKHKIEAINWIMTGDPQFKYYCKLLNIEPSYIVNKVKTHGDTKISYKQKRLLKPIVEKLLKSKQYQNNWFAKHVEERI